MSLINIAHGENWDNPSNFHPSRLAHSFILSSMKCAKGTACGSFDVQIRLGRGSRYGVPDSAGLAVASVGQRELHCGPLVVDDGEHDGVAHGFVS